MGRILDFNSQFIYECGEINIKVYKFNDNNCPFYYINANNNLNDIVEIIDEALTNHKYL